MGMTSIFSEEGENIPCTVIEAGPCVITQVRTVEQDGYPALQLAFGNRKEKHVTKAMKGHFAKAGTTPKWKLAEIRDFKTEKKVGDTITADLFKEGDIVDVSGISKGKGFQGVVKRHGFSGVGLRSHGQHDRERAPGSIGNSSFAARVFKGMRMAGRTGGANVTAKNLTVAKVAADKNLILIRGAVPGYNGAYVIIYK